MYKVEKVNSLVCKKSQSYDVKKKKKKVGRFILPTCFKDLPIFKKKKEKIIS